MLNCSIMGNRTKNLWHECILSFTTSEEIVLLCDAIYHPNRFPQAIHICLMIQIFLKWLDAFFVFSSVTLFTMQSHVYLLLTKKESYHWLLNLIWQYHQMHLIFLRKFLFSKSITDNWKIYKRKHLVVHFNLHSSIIHHNTLYLLNQ